MSPANQAQRQQKQLLETPVPADLRSTLLQGRNPTALREAIRLSFHATADQYESLFALLDDEAGYYEKAIPLRHPLIFYLGHTATFYANKLLLAGLIGERIDPDLESMFAVGVDEMSWDDLDEVHYEWPKIAAVWAYRDKVRDAVDAVIRSLPLDGPIGWDNPWWIILMGIEHERIHLETSSVLIRQQRLEWVKPHAAWQPCRESAAAPENTMVPVPARTFQLGRDRQAPEVYGWDNEFGNHQAETTAFKAAKYLTSNQEFHAFVQARGYEDKSLWSEEGWDWRQFTQAVHPTFWVPDGDTWRLRLLAEEVPMPWNWPVETNFHEAQAFCKWRARETARPVRMPTEDEWQALRLYAGIGNTPQDPPAPANFELDHWASSCPVDRFAHGPFYDVVGNVWQWLATPTYPYPGFDVHPIYDDFTAPTFDAQHNLIKGGSWISCGNQALPQSRYAFRRHFFQHAGFRYIESEQPVKHPETAHYETDTQVSEYCEFHWGDEYFDVPNMPCALAQLAIQAMGDKPAGKALDIGCATGRGVFELARHFDAVTGIDFSARFISVGQQMAERGRIRYTLVDEGELLSYNERVLDDFGLADVASKVSFFQGDACNLKSIVSGYDLIIAVNLIDRLYDPALFLRGVHERINAGGLLVLASPYTWLPEHTQREHWLGGFKQDGENFTTLDGLKAMLAPHFDLRGEPQAVPFVIRETKRKFQHSLTEVTIWEKR